MNRVELASLALRYTAAWCSRDPERVASFFAEDGLLTINGGSPARGRAAIAEVVGGFMSAFPDLAIHMDSVDAPGPDTPRTIYRWTMTGSPPGGSGSGDAMRISGRDEWRLSASAQIQDSQGFFDEADYNRQLTSAGVPSQALRRTSAEPEGPRGLGGWLTLVGLGLCLTPLLFVASLATTYVPLWRSPGWTILTTPGTEFYRPGLAPLFISEALGNGALAAASVYVLVLFFRQSRRFPRMWAIYMLATAAFVLADAFAGATVMQDEPVDAQASTSVSRSLIALCVWMPYLANSKRVKNTFTK